MTLSKLDVMLSVVWVVWWIVFDWLVVALCSGGGRRGGRVGRRYRYVTCPVRRACEV